MCPNSRYSRAPQKGLKMARELVTKSEAENALVRLPAIVADYSSLALAHACEEEAAVLRQACSLYSDGYYDHALLDLWNASVLNLRRRVEAYGMQLFQSVAKDEPGRKKY